VTVWFLSKRVFSEGQAEDAILLGFMGLGQWRDGDGPRRRQAQMSLPQIMQMGGPISPQIQRIDADQDRFGSDDASHAEHKKRCRRHRCSAICKQDTGVAAAEMPNTILCKKIPALPF